MGQLDIFGSEIYEYLLVIEPDQKTTEKLIELRKLVNNTIPLSEETIRSKPHISVCYFEASDFSDELILTKTNQALASIHSFDIRLEGSEQWKNGTLVLKIHPDDNILEMQKQLASVFKGVIKQFHLTIARSITGKLPDLLMQSLQYKNEFKCGSIHILKKKGSRPYELLETIYLKKR